MKIDYGSEELISAFYDYDGEMEDGRKFIIHATWDSWDEYGVDSIDWLEGAEGTNEEEQEIIEQFLADNN